MTNQEFWQSIQQIISSGFQINDLKQLDIYAEWFITRKLVYQRFSQAEQHGCAAGGTNNVIATILAGAEIASDCLTAPIGSFKREVQCGAQQEKRIELWAKAVGCWFDHTEKTFNTLLGSEIASGGEAHVYDNGSTLVKSIGLDYFVLPILALDRIALHNASFPETRMKVLGFGRNEDLEFQIIVEQPFIKGQQMSDAEISTYIQQLGFKVINPRNWTFATEQTYLSDLHDENVLLSAQGNVFVVDCDIRINTPQLNAGGNRTPANAVIIQ